MVSPTPHVATGKACARQQGPAQGRIAARTFTLLAMLQTPQEQLALEQLVPAAASAGRTGEVTLRKPCGNATHIARATS